MENQNPVQVQNQPLAPVQPQPTVEPQPPVQPESLQSEIIKVPSNSSGFPFKRILILLIVLIIIVITGGAYVLNRNSVKIAKTLPSPTPVIKINTISTPTPDPTANWKTYTNSFFALTLKYPQAWKIADQREENRNIAALNKIVKINDVTIKSNNMTLNMAFEENPNFVSNEKYFDFVRNNYGKNEYKYTQIGNVPAILSTFLAGGPADVEPLYHVTATFFKDGRTYLFTLDSAQKEGAQEILLQSILSTFKFTNQTSQTDETASWKTYTSTCGFTVKLPQTWNAAAYLVSGTENSCGRITDPNFKTYPNSDKRDGFYIFLDRKKIGSIYMNTQVNDIESYLLSQEKIMTPQATINNRDDKTIGKFAGTEYDTVGMGGERQFVFINNGYVYTASWPLELTTTNRATIDKIINSISYN